MSTVIVDYCRGNLFSLAQAFRHLGEETTFASCPQDLQAATRLVLPGVGAFKDGMEGLAERGMVGPLRERAAAGTPFLGVCLGMQLMATSSEEFGVTEGLGIVPGKVIRIPEGNGGPDNVRIPNVGWRSLDINAAVDFVPTCTGMVYFVHSYYLSPVDRGCIAARTRINATDVTASIRQDNLFGCQFHPEKSAKAGLAILRRFLEVTA